jgi:hypothetical protein
MRLRVAYTGHGVHHYYELRRFRSLADSDVKLLIRFNFRVWLGILGFTGARVALMWRQQRAYLVAQANVREKHIILKTNHDVSCTLDAFDGPGSQKGLST